MDALLRGEGRGEAFNATAPGLRAIDVARLVVTTMGSKIKVVPGEPVLDQYDEDLDDSKLRALGWSPKVRLQEGIREVAAAFEKRYATV